MRYNPNSGYGRAILDSIFSKVPTGGRIFFVMDPDDTTLQKYQRLQEIFKDAPEGVLHFYTSLESAYAAADSNNGDSIVLDTNSTHLIDTGIAWSKNRINLIGLDPFNRVTQQGAKIQLTAAAIASAYILKVTGTRNCFKGLKIIQNSTDATGLTVLQAAGEGNLYEDCSVIFGAADNLDQTNAYELLLGEDSGTFRRCSFGTDVLLTSAARAVIALDAISGGNADGAKSNRFIDCETVLMSSANTAVHVKLIDTAGAKFLNEFVNLRMNTVINGTNSAAAVTNAIASASGFVEGNLAFYNPMAVNVTNLCAGVTDNVDVVGPAVSAQAGEGVTPS